MSRCLTEVEAAQLSGWKKEGKLQKISGEEFHHIQNGGVAVFCSDGDIDAGPFHRKMVSQRPHSVRVFGGTLIFCPDFPLFDMSFAEKLVANAMLGMSIKKTSTIFAYFHFPCGAAEIQSWGMEQVLESRHTTMNLLANLFRARCAPIVPLFHVKRINKARKMEQNVYLIR